MAKRAVKTTGKVAVGVSDEVILGRTVAPSTGEEDKPENTKTNDDTTDTLTTTTTTKSLEHKPD